MFGDRNCIYNESTQILAYADGIVIVGISIDALKETEEINGSSTGNGTCSEHAEDRIHGSNKKKIPTNIKMVKIYDLEYERVKEFMYLGTI